MGLIRSWRESVAVFVPKNFKLFFLAVLNTFVQSLVPFLLYFGIFFIGLVVVLSFDNSYFEGLHNLAFMRFLALVRLLVLVLCSFITNFGMYAAVRPSVARKNARYFFGLGFHFIWFLVFLFLSRFFSASIELMAQNAPRFFLEALLALFTIYFFFFMLDARPRFIQQFINLKSSFIFIVYNLPFCLISAFVFFVLPRFISIDTKLFSLISSTIGVPALYLLFSTFGTLFVLSWFCVMYTKRVYEQYELYK